MLDQHFAFSSRAAFDLVGGAHKLDLLLHQTMASGTSPALLATITS